MFDPDHGSVIDPMVAMGRAPYEARRRTRNLTKRATGASPPTPTGWVEMKSALLLTSMVGVGLAFLLNYSGWGKGSSLGGLFVRQKYRNVYKDDILLHAHGTCIETQLLLSPSSLFPSSVFNFVNERWDWRAPNTL